MWASHSTLIYTSELILCSIICVYSATRHNIHTKKKLFVQRGGGIYHHVCLRVKSSPINSSVRGDIRASFIANITLHCLF